jgi:hypothetical protein
MARIRRNQTSTLLVFIALFLTHACTPAPGDMDHADSGPGSDATPSGDAGTDRDTARLADASPVSPGDPVTFRMVRTGDAGAAFALRSFADPGDGFWWYSVTTATGTPLRIFMGMLTTRCDMCSPNGSVPVGFQCSMVPADGITATWNGLVYGAQTTCVTSSGDHEPCLEVTRVPPGSYRVTMCATRSSMDCLSGTDRVCVTVPFDYPVSAEVVGAVPL